MPKSVGSTSEADKFEAGDIVYHRLDGKKMIITNEAKNSYEPDKKLWHCRWIDERGEYQGKVFGEIELDHSPVK